MFSSDCVCVCNKHFLKCNQSVRFVFWILKFVLTCNTVELKVVSGHRFVSLKKMFCGDICCFTLFSTAVWKYFFFSLSLLPSPFPVSDHSNLPEIVSKVLTQEMQKIFVNKNLESFNEEFLKHNATSIQHQLSGLFNFAMLLKMSWFQWFKSAVNFFIIPKLGRARSLPVYLCSLPAFTT